MDRNSEEARRGRRIALIIAGIGLFWILITAIGSEYGWSQRTRAFFDLLVLAGFGGALWMTYQLWRSRRNDKD
ncbi:DUF5337 domain-containing protein [Marivita hallyeonensis]|uniref:DUF5337 domain-containing protein n=1 Tax=Marivita hallyeonensis TaxID=996342 RepID=A0A1M5RI09_9RHOB|nr:DUF5337 domain-containing protein [Marivita hallyeonensis]SHH25992.1 hypothetical protein SAMN05443551_1772 [Marivita hallyeonensis]